MTNSAFGAVYREIDRKPNPWSTLRVKRPSAIAAARGNTMEFIKE